MQARLAEDGIRTIGALQRMPEADLARRYGSMGLRLARLVARRGQPQASTRAARRRASAPRPPSTRIIADPRRLTAILRSLSEKVSRRLKQHGLAGRTVTLKLKTADFRLRTRSRQLSDPTRLADRIFHEGSTLLAKEADGTRYRLIGIGVSEFADPNLADPGRPRRPRRRKTRRRRGGDRHDPRQVRQPGGRDRDWSSTAAACTPPARQVAAPVPSAPAGATDRASTAGVSSPVSFPDSENSP